MSIIILNKSKKITNSLYIYFTLINFKFNRSLMYKTLFCFQDYNGYILECLKFTNSKIINLKWK